MNAGRRRALVSVMIALVVIAMTGCGDDKTNNPTTTVDLPDLRVSSGTPTVTPAVVKPGGTFLISGGTIGNYGKGQLSLPFWRNAFLLSTDATLTPEDSFLTVTVADTGYVGRLLGNKWMAKTLTMPADTPPGTYYVGVYADWGNQIEESDESNNFVCVRIDVTNLPDLVIPSGAPTVTPNPVRPESTVSVSAWSIKNQGTSVAGAFDYHYYLSLDGQITSSDIDLGGGTIGSLDEGATVDVPASTLTIPAGTAPHLYYFGIRLDSGNAVEEFSESNNVALTTETVFQLPDLVVSSGPLTLLPGSILPGYSVTVYAGTVANVGGPLPGSGGLFGPSWVNGFYLSADSTITAGDTYLGRAQGHTIVADITSPWDWVTQSVLIPANTPSGSYYLGVFLDRGDRVHESDEGNNFVSARIDVGP